MPERRARPVRRRGPARTAASGFGLVLIVALAVFGPAPALGVTPGAAPPAPGAAIHRLAPPRETCAPNETRLADGFNVCSQSVGGGGFDLGGLSAFIGIIAVGGVLLLLAALVILRRTSAPTVPADPGEWWTCRNCGKTNVLGSARCYACGAWH